MQYIDVFQAGNALARVADPHLVGHADLCGADVCESSLQLGSCLFKVYCPRLEYCRFDRRQHSCPFMKMSSVW